MVTNINSDRDDFPPTYVYFDEYKNWWSRPSVIFLMKNTNIEEATEL